MDCKFCNNKFATKSGLNTHIKTAKYCLKLQGHVERSEYKCGNCNKLFSTLTNLNRHQLICNIGDIYKNKLENITIERDILKNQILKYKIKLSEKESQLEDQKQTIKDLQNKIENIAISAVNRPTKNTQITNYIQQLQPITDEDMSDNVQNLTIDHIIKGAEGYAQYALEYPLKDKVLCSDYSRRKVKFKDKDGNVITDPEMTCLATKFFKSIKDRNKELIMKYGNELKEKFGDEMDTIVSILDYKMAVDKGSEGEKTEFHHEFVKQLCSKTIIE